MISINRYDTQDRIHVCLCHLSLFSDHSRLLISVYWWEFFLVNHVTFPVLLHTLCTPVEKPNDLLSGTTHFFVRFLLVCPSWCDSSVVFSVLISENALKRCLPSFLSNGAFYKAAGATTLLDFLFQTNIEFTVKPEKYFYA